MNDATGKWHRYYPDAFDLANNTVTEVKSTYTLGERFNVNRKLEAKKQATLAVGFNYRLMVMEQDGTCISDTTTYVNH